MGVEGEDRKWGYKIWCNKKQEDIGVLVLEWFLFLWGNNERRWHCGQVAQLRGSSMSHERVQILLGDGKLVLSLGLVSEPKF